jgi:hypothetical protein
MQKKKEFFILNIGTGQIDKKGDKKHGHRCGEKVKSKNS